MDGHAAVHLPHQLRHPSAQLHDLCIIGDDGVHVDHGVAVQGALELHFGGVNDVMQLQNISVSRHLRMEGHHHPTGAIVVDHQIVDAADRRVGQNHLPDPLHQFLLRRLAQQRPQRLLGRLIPGKEDEARHHKAHPTVNHQGGEPSHQHSRQHRRGGDGIGQAVGGRGLHGGGRYPPTDTAVIQVHIQLHGDGCHQNPHRQQTEVHRLRVQDLLHGGLPQLHTHQQDQSRHHQP